MMKRISTTLLFLAVLPTFSPLGRCAQPLSKSVPAEGARRGGPLEDAKHSGPVSHSDATSRLHRLPMAFLENRGQWPAPYRFLARRGPMSIGLRETGVDLRLVRRDEGGAYRTVSVPIEFEACAENAAIRPERVAAGRYNFFVGSDPERWRTGVRGFREVTYPELYEGVDLRWREGAGTIEYDLICRAGSDLAQVRFRCAGIEGLEIDRDGSLLLKTAWGPVRQKPPTSWYESRNGDRHSVAVRFRKIDEERYGFAVADLRDLRLVVDPGLEWSTTLGGSNGDGIDDVAGDEEGAPTVLGSTYSWDFPVTEGAYDETYDVLYNSELFITRLTRDGSGLVYSTFLGGGHDEAAYSIDVDDFGAAYVLGQTQSQDFPITPGAFQPTRPRSPFKTRFVTKLAPGGDKLEYSTFFNETVLHEISAMSDGSVALAGASWGNSPTSPGAFNESYNGGCMTFLGGDAYVAILDPLGSRLVYGTYFGGTSCDGVWGMAVNGEKIVIGGYTASTDLPVTPNAFDSTLNDNYQGQGDAFVAVLAPFDAQPLKLCTYIGGTYGDRVDAVGLDDDGRAYAAGQTVSFDFPVTPGAFDTTFDGSGPWLIRDGFVLRLSSDGTQLEYSTFLGGTGSEYPWALTVEPWGTVTVCGTTDSFDFPTTPEAAQPFFNGGGGVAGGDAFISRLNASGSGLLYSTFLGGSGGSWYGERPWGIFADRRARVVVAGITESKDFPTTPNALPYPGEGFITKINPGPFLSYTGTPTDGALFRFDVAAAPTGRQGALAQVVVSCSGTAGMILPGGLTLSLTQDACTDLSLRLGGVLRCSLDPKDGSGHTKGLAFPAVPVGRILHAAAIIWDGASGDVLTVSDAVALTVR